MDPSSTPPGALGFTQAHSAYQPVNASIAVGVRELGRGERSYVYSGPGAVVLGGAEGSGWVACRNGELSGSYKVFARIQGAVADRAYREAGCVGLEIGVDGVEVAGEYGAWQYT